MLAIIYREFNVVSESTTVEKPRTHSMHVGETYKEVKVTFKFTPVASGETKELVVDGIRSSYDILIQNFILRNFKDSKSAAAIASEYGHNKVTLVKDWDTYFSEHTHTALRKLCGSRASSFWWNLINELPSPIWQYMCKMAVAKVTELQTDCIAGNKLLNIQRVSEAVKAGWTEALDTIYDIIFEGYQRTTDAELKAIGFDPEEVADMPRKKIEEFKKMSRLAYLSVDYLDEDTMRSVCGYFVDYIEV